MQDPIRIGTMVAQEFSTQQANALKFLYKGWIISRGPFSNSFICMFGDGDLGFLSGNTSRSAQNRADLFQRHADKFQNPWVYKIETGTVLDPRWQTVARAGYFVATGAPDALRSRQERNVVENQIFKAALDGTEFRSRVVDFDNL